VRVEYLVCLVQENRVTFENGHCQGEGRLDIARGNTSLESCPLVWDFLQSVGAEGWELVAVVDSAYEAKEDSMHFQQLYLKRVAR
jgi:hypothetical protein